MTQDEQLIDYLNHEEGLYDALLRDLSLSKEKRVSVKRIYRVISFGGRYSSSKFKINQEVSEINWLQVMSKFKKVIEFKEQVENIKQCLRLTALNMI